MESMRAMEMKEVFFCYAFLLSRDNTECSFLLFL